MSTRRSLAAAAAAVTYAREFGWHIFPRHPDKPDSFKAKRFSDAPWGATNDPERVKHDFECWPQARIGARTGFLPGVRVPIVVVDTDTRAGGHAHDGEPELKKLEARHGTLPLTLTGRSPSGSLHRYLRHPGAGIWIRSSDSVIAPGVDIKGDNSCITVPPSINADGTYYEWVDASVPIADMPQWLIALTIKPSPTISERAGIQRPPGDRSSTSYGLRALHEEIKTLCRAKPGHRNSALNYCAFRLFQLVPHELDGDEVERQLLQAIIINGARDGKTTIKSTIESGKAAGLANPRIRRPRP
jgi:hypothetical protein